MSENQDFDEVIDEQDIGSNDDEQEGEAEWTTADKKKNTSNFKALYKKAQELERENASKDEKLAILEAELEEWRNLNPEVQETLQSKKDLASMQEQIFFVKNPDAEPYAKDINKTMKEYNLPNSPEWISKAWKLVKSEIPEESKTKTDFNIWKKAVTKKNLKDVTPEEALELPKEERRKWRELNGFWG